MKSNAILTFHNAHNNGSMLQACALQYILKTKFDDNFDIIDFSNAAQRNMYSPFPKMTNYKKVIKNCIWWFVRKQLRDQFNDFECFKNTYMHLSENKYFRDSELASIGKIYDKVIAGSDQVWNIKCLDADDAYYLDFSNNIRKFAYSVSFGANNPFTVSEDPDHYRKLLDNFEMISVREHNAQKWISSGTGKIVPVTLDPTVLLTSDEWESFVDIGDPIIKEDYIFYYCFSINSKVKKFLQWLSKEKNMPVYFMDVKEWQLKMCWLNGIKLVNKFGPISYLNLVKNASYFVTTSFHGTAFATIFRKRFWYIDSGNNDPSKDDRAISFLTQLGLMDRYQTIEQLKRINLDTFPNYDTVYSKLDVFKEQSFRYLSDIVKA